METDKKDKNLGNYMRAGIPIPIYGYADGSIRLAQDRKWSVNKLEKVAPVLALLTAHRPEAPRKKAGRKPKSISQQELTLNKEIQQRFLCLVFGELKGAQIWTEGKGKWRVISHDGALLDYPKKMNKSQANRILSKELSLSLSRIRQATDPSIL